MNNKTETSPESANAGRTSAAAVQAHGPSQPVPVSKPGPEELSLEGFPVEPDPLQQARQEAAESKDRWLRTAAELENFRKRASQEKSRLLMYRNEELLRDLLPVADNLDRALNHCTEAGRSDSLSEGLCMVLDMLRGVLAKHGVKEIESLGKPFDPRFHEAIAQTPAAGAPPNLVIEELEKGYLYQDRLLRPAKVVVSAPAPQGSNP